ncbi:methylglyoxal synthase [Rhodospirillaceae bacterium]|jgi:methylglyoxal synthase|nr:methylglyoxal synthase [Rhodospirillaceae bacterium]|tara:strand:- start:2913 stop:3953 length:1041 start_codon:yes stop_codon:yes gene_type:complete
MLTENDRTIIDANAKLTDALAGGARHIGFKDIGLPLEQLKLLADRIREVGGVSYLEVVSLDAQREFESAEAAIKLDVDCLLGGTHATEVLKIIGSNPIRYFPFPGRVVGHPSVLEGSIEEITESAVSLTALEGVHGLDLLAYRFAGDVPALMKSVCEKSTKPVVIAGSINSEERILAAAGAGATAFTVGTAALAGNFPAESEGLISQVHALMSITMRAGQISTSPRRIALVAHNERKTQLTAWVGRHLTVLRQQTIICTGGTGAMLRKAYPSLTINRLQRGTRGGDQQLGALVATGELDAVVFFADPHTRHAQDVDLIALTRLAIMHDTPIVCSPSAADLVVLACH